MRVSRKSLTFAAAVVVAGAPLTRAAFTPISLGLADPVRGASERPAAAVAGTGVGIAIAANGNATVAERITSDGNAVLLNGLGGTNARVYAVNGSGVAAGDADKGSLGVRAVKWLPGSSVAVELATDGLSSAGTTTSRAYMIGADGSAVGYADQYVGGTKVATNAVRWTPGNVLIRLGIVGDAPPATAVNPPATAFVNGVNDVGVGVGIQVKYSGATRLGRRPVKWLADGAAIELQNLGGNNDLGFAYAVNHDGVAVGNLHKFDANDNDLDLRAVRWDVAGQVEELGNLGTYTSGSVAGQISSSAYAVNKDGVAVGNASKTSSSDNQAVRWGVDGIAIPLANLNNSLTNSAAYGINDAGLVVGTAPLTATPAGYTGFASDFYHATLWAKDNSVLDLNSLIDPSLNFVMGTAYSITNDSWVAGIGRYYPDGYASPLTSYARAFLIQVPEPASIAALGLFTLLSHRRRFILK